MTRQFGLASAVVLAASFLFTRSATATNILLTENDSTHLVSSLGASAPITNLGPDLWDIDVSSLVGLGLFNTSEAWIEPDNASTANYLQALNQTTLQLQSDVPIAQLQFLNPRCAGGTPLPDSTPCFIGGDATGAVLAAVHDVSDGSVPEPASMLLFGTGLIGVGAMRHWRTRRQRD